MLFSGNFTGNVRVLLIKPKPPGESAGRKTFTHNGGVVSQFDVIPNKLVFVWLVCLNERNGRGLCKDFQC